MKKAFYSLATALLLVQCGPSANTQSVKVLKRTLVMEAGKPTPVAFLRGGEMVEVKLPLSPQNNAAEVTLADGTHGFVPISALALPDSLKPKQ